MSTGENILMLILGIVLMVGSLWLTYRSDRERWKEYFRSTRKVYWVIVLVGLFVGSTWVICCSLSSICIWNFIPSGNIEQL